MRRARGLRRVPSDADTPDGRDVLFVVAGCANRAVAAQLPRGGVGHVAAAALDVTAARITAGPLAEPLQTDVCELLEWAEAAPPAIIARAVRLARAVIATAAVPTVEPLGALDRWRREMADGSRTTAIIDPLWRAATWETVAMERRAQGDVSGARDAMEQAAGALLADVPPAAPARAPVLARVA